MKLALKGAKVSGKFSDTNFPFFRYISEGLNNVTSFTQLASIQEHHFDYLIVN
jgi:hypothetical protein